MIKIDWATAIGGAVLGYYAKGRVEAAKSQFKGICTCAIKNIKESFSEDSESHNTQVQSNPQGTGKNG